MEQRTKFIFAGIEFVQIPAGKFLMGSSDTDVPTYRKRGGLTYDDEKPQHEVHIPYDYYIGRFPVTNEQYDITNTEYSHYVTALVTDRHPVRDWEEKRDHPVVNVSWYGANEYCRRLNEMHGAELPIGYAFRLPTEAEWEKAARGTNGCIYPWGDTFDASKCNTREDIHSLTTPVGAFSPQGDSPYGCVDMFGNVWEWTHSLLKGYPYEDKDGREDENASGSRVVRGAIITGARSASRVRQLPKSGYNMNGFRVVVAPPLPQSSSL